MRAQQGVDLKDRADTEDRCPWCEQLIPHEKYREIHDRIAANEQRRTAEVQARLQADFDRQRAEADAKSKTQVEAIRKEAATAVESAKKESARVVAAARKEGKKLAEATLAPKVTAADKARVAAEKELAAQKANEQATIDARVLEVREAMQKDKAKAIDVEQANAFKDRQKLTQRLQALERQLQKKTADELGEGAEIDLFDALRAEFSQDDLQRVKKGEAGADIVHDVVQNGRNCGRIVYDSKNRAAWRNDYVTKLRKDQLAAKADHAILASRAFPAGTSQLCIRDGVILANPARVIPLVQMIRAHVVQIAGLRLSNEAREEKMAKLYDFITSDRCRQLLDQIDTLTDDLLELEVKEKKAHDGTWRRRGELIRAVQQTRGNLSTEIDLIVSAPEPVKLRRAK